MRSGPVRRKLSVLRLPRERQPRPQRRPRAPPLLQDALCTAPATLKAAAAPAATTRAAAPPGRSVYCACHAKGSRGPSLPRERQPRPQQRPRAPQLRQEALCTAPATRKAAAAPAATTRPAALPGGSVLRLPRDRQPGPQRRPRAPQLLQDALCVLRLPRERQTRLQRRPRAPELRQEALCTAPAGGSE